MLYSKRTAGSRLHRMKGALVHNGWFQCPPLEAPGLLRAVLPAAGAPARSRGGRQRDARENAAARARCSRQSSLRPSPTLTGLALKYLKMLSPLADLSLQSGVFPSVIPVPIPKFENPLADSGEDRGDGDPLAAKPWEHLRAGLAKRSLCPLLGKPNSAPEREPMSHHRNGGDSRPRVLPATDRSTQATATSRDVHRSIQRWIGSPGHGLGPVPCSMCHPA